MFNFQEQYNKRGILGISGYLEKYLVNSGQIKDTQADFYKHLGVLPKELQYTPGQSFAEQKNYNTQIQQFQRNFEQNLSKDPNVINSILSKTGLNSPQGFQKLQSGYEAWKSKLPADYGKAGIQKTSQELGYDYTKSTDLRHNPLQSILGHDKDPLTSVNPLGWAKAYAQNQGGNLQQTLKNLGYNAPEDADNWVRAQGANFQNEFLNKIGLTDDQKKIDFLKGNIIPGSIQNPEGTQTQPTGQAGQGVQQYNQTNPQQAILDFQSGKISADQYNQWAASYASGGQQQAPAGQGAPAGQTTPTGQGGQLPFPNPKNEKEVIANLQFSQQNKGTQQQPTAYTVKSGDTLSAIARANGVSIDDISGYRSGNPDLIFPGEQLTINKPFTPPVINEGGAGTGITDTTKIPPDDPANQYNTDTGELNPNYEAPLTETQKGYGSYLAEQTFNSLYDKMKTDLGLNDLKTQIANANQSLLNLKDKKAAEAADINANPWISENLRIDKLKGLEGKYEQRLGNLEESLSRKQKQYDSGVQQAQWASKLMIDQYNNDRAFYYKAKQDAQSLAQQSETTGLKEQLLEAQIGATNALKAQRLGGVGGGSGGGVNGDEPITITDFTDTAQLEDLLKTVKLTTGQKGDIADMMIVQRQISDLNNLAKKYGGFIGAGPGGTANQFLASVTGKTREGAQDIRNSIGQIKGFIAKLRGGTSFTPNEQRLLDTYTPTINDSDPIIRSKLNSLSKYVNDKIETTIIVAGGTLNKSLSGNQQSDPLGLFQ